MKNLVTKLADEVWKNTVGVRNMRWFNLSLKEKNKLRETMESNKHLNPLIDTCHELWYECLENDLIKSTFISSCPFLPIQKYRAYDYGTQEDYQITQTYITAWLSELVYYLYLWWWLKLILQDQKYYIEQYINAKATDLKMKKQQQPIY